MDMKQRDYPLNLRFFLLLCLSFTLTGCDFAEDRNRVLGTIERDRILLTAVESLFIVDIFTEEGQVVKKGAALVQLDDTIAKSEVKKALADLEVAKAYLLKLQNGARAEDVAAARARLVSVKASLDYEGKNYIRVKKLVN